MPRPLIAHEEGNNDHDSPGNRRGQTLSSASHSRGGRTMTHRQRQPPRALQRQVQQMGILEHGNRAISGKTAASTLNAP